MGRKELLWYNKNEESRLPIRFFCLRFLSRLNVERSGNPCRFVLSVVQRIRKRLAFATSVVPRWCKLRALLPPHRLSPPPPHHQQRAQPAHSVAHQLFWERHFVIIAVRRSSPCHPHRARRRPRWHQRLRPHPPGCPPRQATHHPRQWIPGQQHPCPCPHPQHPPRHIPPWQRCAC